MFTNSWRWVLWMMIFNRMKIKAHLPQPNQGHDHCGFITHISIHAAFIKGQHSGSKIFSGDNATEGVLWCGGQWNTQSTTILIYAQFMEIYGSGNDKVLSVIQKLQIFRSRNIYRDKLKLPKYNVASCHCNQQTTPNLFVFAEFTTFHEQQSRAHMCAIMSANLQKTFIHDGKQITGFAVCLEFGLIKNILHRSLKM